MKSKGIVFENLFDPDVMGDGPTAPGYMVNGVPLRFAALKYGTKRADVGYAEKGVDVSNKWAAKGTAVYQSVTAFVASLAVVIPNGWVGIANTASRFQLFNDGTGSRGRGPTLPATVFDWTSDGKPPLKDYECRLSAVVVDQDNSAWSFVNNTASAWVALDDLHSVTVATLTFVPSSNGGQGDFAAHGLFEMREKATGTIVKSVPMNITGTAQNA